MVENAANYQRSTSATFRTICWANIEQIILAISAVYMEHRVRTVHSNISWSFIGKITNHNHGILTYSKHHYRALVTSVSIKLRQRQQWVSLIQIFVSVKTTQVLCWATAYILHDPLLPLKIKRIVREPSYVQRLRWVVWDTWILIKHMVASIGVRTTGERNMIPRMYLIGIINSMSFV